MLTSLSTSTGQPSSAASVSRTGKRFQPGMIGGDTGTPSRKLTGPGTPTPAPAKPGARRAARSLPTISSARPMHDLRALPDVDRLGRAREHPQLAVGDRDVDRGGADVDAEEAGVAGDPHDRRTAAAAGGGQAGGLDQAERDQPVELDREPGPGQLDRVAELGPRARSVVAQQPEQARLLRVVRPDDRHAAPRVPRSRTAPPDDSG